MQACAPSTCQWEQHISHHTAPLFHTNQQQGALQCTDKLKKLYLQPGMLPAASGAADNAVDSAVDSPTAAVRLADCPTSADTASNSPTAAHAVVQATTSPPSAQAATSAVGAAAAAAAADWEASGSGRGTLAAQEEPASAPGAHDAEQQWHNPVHCAQSALGLSARTSGAAKLDELQEIDHDHAVHNVSVDPSPSCGLDASQMVGSLFCCPITRVRCLASLACITAFLGSLSHAGNTYSWQLATQLLHVMYPGVCSFWSDCKSYNC